MPSSPAPCDLPPRTPLPDHAVLAGEGHAAPLIVHPDMGDGCRALADRIATALRAFFGVSADVAPASGIQVAEYARRTVVLLGNLLTNPEILWLYALGHTFVDAVYPGGDGHVIHRVFDPVGSGQDALVLGASSNGGLWTCVDRFVAELSRLDGPRWPTRVVLKSDLDIVADPPERLDDGAVQELRAESLARMQEGGLYREAYGAIHSAQHYYLTGCEAYLDRYRARLLAHADFTATGLDQFYGGLEFWLPAYIQAWDCAEHSDRWTDGDRRETVAFLLRLMDILTSRYGESYFGRRVDGRPRPRWNHETFPAMSCFYMAEYLRKHHPGVPSAERWGGIARDVLGDQARFVRGTDESYLYFPYAPSHALRYALCTRDRGIFASGRAAALGQLLHMATDSTGRCVGVGAREHRDVASWCLLPLAAALRDGRFLGVNAKARSAAERPTECREEWGPVMARFGEFRPPLAPVTPGEESHVRVFPMDAELYRLTNTEGIGPYPPVSPVTVSLERAFDKLVFRRSYGSGPYLLLDGFGRGRHLRMDTNAILRFADRDRVFLVETDSDRMVAEKYHNTVTVIRDGRGGGHAPPYAELLAAVDLESAGLTRTRVTGYGDVDWTRDILWLKDRGFVILDRFVARVDGEYTLRCHWNGLGDARIEGPAMILEQDGERCAVTHGGGMTWSLAHDERSAKDVWEGYPHARPVIARARQARTVVLRAGEGAGVGNFLHAFASHRPPAVSCETLEDAAFRLTVGGFRGFVFVDPARLPSPWVADAAMGILEAERLCLVGVRNLALGGNILLRSDSPVHVELDLSGGRAVFAGAGEGVARLAGLEGPVIPCPERRAFPWNAPESLRPALAEALERVGSGYGGRSLQDLRPRLPAASLAEAELVREPTCALFPPTGVGLDGAILLGDGEGVEALRLEEASSMWSLWRSRTEEPVAAIAFAGSRAPAVGRVICGVSDGTVSAFSPGGVRAWSRRMSGANEAARRVVSLSAGDADGDGFDEIAVGSASWNVYLLDREGREIWSRPAYAHTVTCLAFADIDGDGRAEVLSGTDYYTLSAFDAAGDVLLGHSAQPLFRAIATAELGTGQGVSILAANDGDVLVLDVDRAKARPQKHVKGGAMPRSAVERFRFSTGDDVHAVAVADLDGDGRPEILAGSESGFVYGFDPVGGIRHVRAMGAAVRCLAVGSSAWGAPRVAVGLETGVVRVLNPALTPVAEAVLLGEPRWLSAAGPGLVACVSTRSVARVHLPD